MRNNTNDSLDIFDFERTENLPMELCSFTTKGFIQTKEQNYPNISNQNSQVFLNDFMEEYLINQETIDLSKEKYNVFKQNSCFSLLLLSKNLIELDLSSNNLTFFPIEIIHLPLLKRLKLDHNALKTILIDIDRLKNLEFLSISNNFLTIFPASFQNLHLKVLNIGKNLIQEIEPIFSIKTLEVLYLYGNPFISFPTSFHNLKNLKEIALEWFKYAEPGINPILKRPQHNVIIDRLLDLCCKKHQKSIFSIEFLDFLKAFSTNKLDFKQKDSKGRCLLHNAASEDEIGVLYAISLKTPQLLNFADKDGQTPLTLALLEEKFRSVDCLLDLQGDLRLGGGIFGSCLHIAVSKLQVNLVEKILKNLSSRSENLASVVDLEYNSPFHVLFSIFSKKETAAIEIAEKLLSFRVNPNIKNKELYTPLHLAIKKNQLKALSFAVNYNKTHGKVFDFLKKGGNSKWSLCHLAAFLGNIEALQLLQQANADFFTENTNFQSPLRVSYQSIVVIKTIRKGQKAWILNNILKNKPCKDNFNGNIQDSEEIIAKNMKKKQQFFRNFLGKASFKSLHPQILKVESTKSSFVQYIRRNSTKNEKKLDFSNKTAAEITKENPTELEDLDEFHTEENLTKKMLNKSSQIVVNNPRDKENSPIKLANLEENIKKTFSFDRLEVENFKVFEEMAGFLKEIDRVKEILGFEMNKPSNFEEKANALFYLKCIKEKIEGNFNKFSCFALPVNLFLLNECKLNEKNRSKNIFFIEIVKIFEEIYQQCSQVLSEQACNLCEMKGKKYKNINEELKIRRNFNEIFNYNLKILLLLHVFEKNPNFKQENLLINSKIPKILLFEKLQIMRKNRDYKEKTHNSANKSTNNISVIINNNFFFTNDDKKNSLKQEKEIKKRKHTISFIGITPEKLENENNFKSFSSTKPYFLV